MEGNGGWDSPIWVKSSRGMFIGKTLYHIRVCVFFSLGSWHCWNIRSFDSNVQALVLILRWRFLGYCFVVSSAIDTLLRLSETSPNTSLVYRLNPSYKRVLFNYTWQHKLHFRAKAQFHFRQNVGLADGHPSFLRCDVLLKYKFVRTSCSCEDV
jgi:hypothetical protein